MKSVKPYQSLFAFKWNFTCVFFHVKAKKYSKTTYELITSGLNTWTLSHLNKENVERDEKKIGKNDPFKSSRTRNVFIRHPLNFSLKLNSLNENAKFKNIWNYLKCSPHRSDENCKETKGNKVDNTLWALKRVSRMRQENTQKRMILNKK